MKRLFKNLTKLSLVSAFVFFAGLSFAYTDGGKFITYDPMGGSHGITSVSKTGFNARANSINVHIPQAGDSQNFKLYLAYQNVKNNAVLWDAKGTLDFDHSGTSATTSIRGILSGSHAEYQADSATISGLPSSWKLELVSARKINTHDEATYPECSGSGAPYNYNIALNTNDLSSTGAFIDHLDWIGTWHGVTGSCDQGYIVANFKVTNTTTQATALEVYTGSATAVNADSAELHGTLNSGDDASVWFVLGTNANPSCSGTRLGTSHHRNTGDSFFYTVSGLNPGTTYYYRACAEDATQSDDGNVRSFTTAQQQQQVEVRTNPVTGLSRTQAQLNGELIDGAPASIWFVFDEEGTSLSCNNGTQKVGMMTASQSPYTYSYVKTGLAPNTSYHYMACAEPNISTPGQGVHGSIVSFTTPQQNVTSYTWNTGDWGQCHNGLQTRDVWCEDNNGNVVNDVNCSAATQPISQRACDGTQPEAETRSVSDLNFDSATLRGKVDMNDYHNGLVFFVYGKSFYRVDDVALLDRYTAIDEDGQNLQKVVVDNDLDDAQSYEEEVDGLLSDTKYYYRICVDYKENNGDHALECGGVRHFTTDTSSDNSQNGNSHDGVDIRTEGYSNVTSNSAKVCGNLVDNGGDDTVLRWMEYRREGISWALTGRKYASEGYYCTTMTHLRPGTKYYYRACTQYGCGDEKYFITPNNNTPVVGKKPIVSTEGVKSVYPHSAIVSGFYVSNAEKAKVWFNYGRTETLTSATPKQTVYGAYGGFTHHFRGLKANQRYCYQAMIETEEGTDYGAIKCFVTPPASSTKVIYQPKVEVVKEDNTNIDLAKLGLGLSFVRLDIDDNLETVTKGQHLTYKVTWENISKDINLDTLKLNVQIPREVRILASSRGKMDQDRNAIVYTINKLDAGESGSMTIDGLVEDGRLGDALTAEAALAFDNPINHAQEDARDYDVDDYVIQTAVGTASVFGLANITFLGWLAILLGLLIVFLIARWLYLEREELRAQAYVNGYGRNYLPYHPGQPVVPQQPVAPVRHVYHDVPMQGGEANQNPQAPAQNNHGEQDGYYPYRPNRN